MNDRVHDDSPPSPGVREGFGEAGRDVDNQPAGASDPLPAGPVPLPVCKFPGCNEPSLKFCEWHRSVVDHPTMAGTFAWDSL